MFTEHCECSQIACEPCAHQRLLLLTAPATRRSNVLSRGQIFGLLAAMNATAVRQSQRFQTWRRAATKISGCTARTNSENPKTTFLKLRPKNAGREKKTLKQS